MRISVGRREVILVCGEGKSTSSQKPLDLIRQFMKLTSPVLCGSLLMKLFGLRSNDIFEDLAFLMCTS